MACRPAQTYNPNRHCNSDFAQAKGLREATRASVAADDKSAASM